MYLFSWATTAPAPMTARSWVSRIFPVGNIQGPHAGGHFRGQDQQLAGRPLDRLRRETGIVTWKENVQRRHAAVHRAGGGAHAPFMVGTGLGRSGDVSYSDAAAISRRRRSSPSPPPTRAWWRSCRTAPASAAPSTASTRFIQRHERSGGIPGGKGRHHQL